MGGKCCTRGRNPTSRSLRQHRWDPSLDSDLLIEERPEAYKDVQCVVEDMTAENVCKGVVVLRPIVTYKVREGGDRR